MSLLNRISFVKKIIILFIGSVAIPLFIQNYVYYTQTEKSIQQEMISKLNDSLDAKADKINLILSSAITLSRRYIRNEMLYRSLNMCYEDDISYFMVYQNDIKKLIENDLLYHQQIKSIFIYTDNNTLFNGAYIRKYDKLNADIIDENIMEMNEGKNPLDNLTLRTAWEPKRGNPSDDRSLSLFGEMNYYKQYGRFEKLLRVDINLISLGNILSESNLFDNIILTDSKGRVISSVDHYNSEGEYDVFFPLEIEKGIEVLSKEMNNFPIILYGLYDTKIISEKFNNSRMQTLLITLMGLIIAVVFVFAVGGNISKRLDLVVNQSKEIANGNFIQVEYDVNGQDEISILEKGMNQMSSRLKNSFEKDYRMELRSARLKQETTKAKLLALQSQINPHVLFNSLESIRLKAMAKGEKETARMIKYMSKMLRNSISWDESVIQLSDEIKFLDEFFNLQYYRFEDEFSYDIDVEEETLMCMIPKMIVQTLVENACIHGVEAISNSRIVSFKANIKGEKLKLTVEDNGGGMTPERLESIKAMLRGEGKVNGSIGIYNVYKRLQLYYEGNFKFDIESTAGVGTICTIYIPARYE